MFSECELCGELITNPDDWRNHGLEKCFVIDPKLLELANEMTARALKQMREILFEAQMEEDRKQRAEADHYRRYE